ncbi:hypothetical protein OSTOST_14496 [Ostertagia ostertagi]
MNRGISFVCSSCEQYNGFDESGGYNRKIPGQHCVGAITPSKSYVIKQSICCLCLCQHAFPRKLAFAYLEDVSQEFLNQHATRIDQVARPYQFP